MALAFMLAVPLAYLATAAGREKPTLNPVTRSLLTILRGIPELVWALLFVRVFGLGPAAGVLALGLTYGGMLARPKFSNRSTPLPARALRHSAPPPLAILYGLLPQASKELASYTVYRWECAIRASVVMGFVGAGGLGQLMDQAMKMLNGGEAATILLTFMAAGFWADGLSGWLRRALDTPPAAACLALRLAQHLLRLGRSTASLPVCACSTSAWRC
jgi:phosphonate transport system permease protein